MAIDASLRSGQVPMTDIAKKFGVPYDSVCRHSRNGHVPVDVAELELLELTGDDPLEDARAILEAAGQLMNRALQTANLDLQIRALEACGKQLERAAKLWGQMPPDTEIQFLQVIVPDGSQAGQIESGRTTPLLAGAPGPD